MIQKIKNVISKDKISFLILFIAFAIIHIRMNTNFGDDIVYRKQYVHLWDTLSTYYRVWGAPSLPSVACYFFIKSPGIVFKTFNILFVILAGYSILKITHDDNSKQIK